MYLLMNLSFKMLLQPPEDFGTRNSIEYTPFLSFPALLEPVLWLLYPTNLDFHSQLLTFHQLPGNRTWNEAVGGIGTEF